MRPDVQRSLLLIDADQAQHRLIASVASRAGWRVEAARGDAVARADSESGQIAAILLGDWAPGKAELIARLRADRPSLPLLVCADGAASVEAMRAGASDCLDMPIAPDRLLAALAAAADRRKTNGELRPLSRKISKSLGFDEIIGSTPEFRAALAAAAKAARSKVPVLIEGEHGSGKEMLAQAIHAAGPRGQNRMVAVDCGAIIPNLLESHLFGHEKGAFPGAFDRHAGRIEEADGSTLFLDRVEELSPHLQARLLHVVETGEVQRVGGRGFRPVDIRILATSNRPLLDIVQEGGFREDLYYRLAPVTVAVPPLRARRADIPALARHLLARFAEQPGMRHLGITDDALSLLMAYGWPGNVRQLQNALFRASLGCEGHALTAADFPQIRREISYARRADDYHAPLAATSSLANAPGITLYRSDGHLRLLEEIEADVIRLAIGHYHGRMSEVARRLGIGRSTLYRKLAELGISDAA